MDPTTPRRHGARIAYNTGSPFAMPRRDYVGDVDIDKVNASSDDREGTPRNPGGTLVAKRVQTKPTPTFRGSTVHPKQAFVKKYKPYCHQLLALETSFFRSFRMPVGACVEDERRRLITMFAICKLLVDKTEVDGATTSGKDESLESYISARSSLY
ncbi:hypothetical protein F441_07783 [Phytophthora nicotianae CJ01A1]|uniref:Uncharacterized protein n=3 Tax=Phytophthora nicotianae TaxID=4792 RepID=W2J4Z5_PHYNI|nr:hypothetical protein L915_07638 [Phytophthora nicotianae]ETL41466.1 hypothetical protein L916_07569 [Phytophthora nicotianae]ETO76825.1 hypothetical protein F444_07860 [Phytophthora nicotianae P1976]ETP17918.1 hypothetical protein F441_07783 [Phytophthora nicotianae CJ01A1]